MPPPRSAARPPARVQFDLTSLRLFVATAERGGISRAAEQMALAPAAASRRISDLEAQFGLPLFERRPHGMTLTEAGHALLAHARSILQAATRMQDDAASFRGGERGVVRIAACKSVVLQFLPADLQRCREACPGVRIELQEMNSRGVLQAMARGEAELGIFESTLGPVGLATRPYRSDELVLLVPAGHALARRRRVRLADIAEQDLIALNAGSASALTLERHAGGRPLRMRMRVDSYDSMAAMVAQRLGIGLMPAAVALAHRRSAPVRVLPLDEPWALRHFLLCEQPAEAMGQSAHAISRLLAPLPGPVSQTANPG